MLDSAANRADGWLLFSVLWNRGREDTWVTSQGLNLVRHRKNKGPEEETLVTSSGPVSQVLW